MVDTEDTLVALVGVSGMEVLDDVVLTVEVNPVRIAGNSLVAVERNPGGYGIHVDIVLEHNLVQLAGTQVVDERAELFSRMDAEWSCLIKTVY